MIEPNSFSSTWGTLDDVVMGGNSMSVISCKKDEGSSDYYVEFKGDISLRNGGFCGARTSNASPPLDLSSFSGVSIQTRSKQNYIYQVSLRDTSGFGVAWSRDFEVRKDDENWQEHRLPLDSFIPTRFGRIVNTGRKINRNTIYLVRVALSGVTSTGYQARKNTKFEEGEFYMQFKNIRAYK